MESGRRALKGRSAIVVDSGASGVDEKDSYVEICQLAEKFKGYVYNGLGGMVNPDFDESGPAPADEDGEIPF